MEISCEEILKIKTAMGKHHDIILVKDGVLSLHWWTNQGVRKMVVDDYNGYREYFDPFMKRVIRVTEEFNNEFGENYPEDEAGYLQLRRVYLGG